MALGASGACGACGGEFFWRLPSGAFCLEALEQAVGLAVPGDPPILKVAGWVAGRELEPAENAAPCCVRLESEDGVVEVGGPEDRAAVFAGCANSAWSGLVSLEPGTRLRLKGPSSFRLCCGRVRHALPGAVLGPFQGEEWFEVNCRKASQEAVIEMSEPRKERASAIGPGSAQGPVKEGGGAWRPVPWARLRPAGWAKVAATSSGWADARGRPAAVPVWRQKRCEPRKPRLALMVVMAAVPPDSGVGCMTPNWTLLAALEEALCRACGAGGYELFVAPVAEEEQLERLQPSEVQRQLCRAGRWGMVYFLSPQRVQGQFRTKHDLVHDVPLFNLMEALERAGIPTVWPHPSHLYRILAGKEWPAQLCLSEQYRVPATTLVPRQAVEGDAAAAAAAQAAWGALGLLRAARGVGGVPGAVVKLGYAWRSSGVRLVPSLEQLGPALQAAASGRHTALMVQELIPGILCEAMVYVLRGEAWGFPQYYRFPQHQAPPQYLPRKAAQRLLGEELMARSEDSMRVLTKRWLLWARAVCACEVPFLRLDFLLTEEGVWTGEVSELGVAVELQGLHPQESRDLVMDAVIGSILDPVNLSTSVGAGYGEGK